MVSLFESVLASRFEDPDAASYVYVVVIRLVGAADAVVKCLICVHGGAESHQAVAGVIGKCRHLSTIGESQHIAICVVAHGNAIEEGEAVLVIYT